MTPALARLFEGDTEETGLSGSLLGTIERRYGLLRCEESVVIREVFDRSGDLAVADRVAFVMAGRMHAQVAVFEYDGWYYVGTLDRHLSSEQAAALEPPPGGNPRLLSLVTERGIAPIVSPLVR